VCDTSTHSTILWSEWIYNRCYDWVRVAAAARPCDLYLVPCPDVPWIPDPQRTLGPRRGEFHDRVVAMLGAAGLPMRLISGSWEERRRTAIAAFEELLAAGGAA
jgi:nicotinamide riboside kinase